MDEYLLGPFFLNARHTWVSALGDAMAVMGIRSCRLLITRRDPFREACEIAYYMEGQPLEQVLKWPAPMRVRAWEWLRKTKDQERKALDQAAKK